MCVIHLNVRVVPVRSALSQAGDHSAYFCIEVLHCYCLSYYRYLFAEAYAAAYYAVESVNNTVVCLFNKNSLFFNVPADPLTSDQ